KLEPSMTREPEISGGYIFKKDHTSRRERKTFDDEGPQNAPQVTNRVGFPTGPGGFPGDPDGFLPPYDSRTGTRTTKIETTTRNLGDRLTRTRLTTGVVPAVEVETVDELTPRAERALLPPAPPPV